jgi:hypothetical protein
MHGADRRDAVVLVGSQQLLGGVHGVAHDVVAEQDGERVGADELFGAQDRIV